MENAGTYNVAVLTGVTLVVLGKLVIYDAGALKSKKAGYRN